MFCKFAFTNPRWTREWQERAYQGVHPPTTEAMDWAAPPALNTHTIAEYIRSGC